MKPITIFTLSFTILLFFSCASRYDTFTSSEKEEYRSRDSRAGYEFSYDYMPVNKKYNKKQQRNDVRLVKATFFNQTEDPIIIGRDVKLAYQNGESVCTLTPEEAYKKIRQSTATHLFYLPVTWVGVAFSGSNVYISAKANKHLKQDLIQYNLMGETVLPGETRSGLLALHANTYDALKLELND